MEDLLSSLLMEWESRLESGSPISAEELCVGSPELLTELKRRIDLLEVIQPFFHDEPLQDPPLALAIEGYEVLSLLGQGGSSHVYLARDLQLDRLTAIKVPHRYLTVHAKVMSRIAQEARMLAALKHPNIVTVYSVGKTRDYPYLAVEYVKGGHLRQHLEQWQTNPQELVAIMARACEGLAYIHQNKLLHRDLKPSNILLDTGKQPRIADFGLAALLQPDGTLQTASTFVVGTPAYMAPEQARNQRELLGPATDLWSMGVILYELSTGKLPFGREGVSPRLAQKPMPRLKLPSQLNPRFNKDFDLIVSRCLQVDPLDRYPSALDLKGDLDRWLAGDPLSHNALRSCYHFFVKQKKIALTSLLFFAMLLVFYWLGRSFTIGQQEYDDHALFDQKCSVLQAALLQQKTLNLLEPSEHPKAYLWHTGDRKRPFDFSGSQQLRAFVPDLLDLFQYLPPAVNTIDFRFEIDTSINVERGGQIGLYIARCPTSNGHVIYGPIFDIQPYGIVPRMGIIEYVANQYAARTYYFAEPNEPLPIQAHTLNCTLAFNAKQMLLYINGQCYMNKDVSVYARELQKTLNRKWLVNEPLLPILNQDALFPEQGVVGLYLNHASMKMQKLTLSIRQELFALTQSP